MPIDQLFSDIRQRLDVEALCRELFPDMRGRGAERSVRCPFHEDSNPSLSLNVQEGIYFCHGCGAGGDIFRLYERVRSTTGAETLEQLALRVGLNVDDYRTDLVNLHRRNEQLLRTYNPDGIETHAIDGAVVAAHHQQLLRTFPALTLLQERRGLSQATVERFQLGFDGQRYYIPVYDEDGRCVNIRRYKPNATRAQDKMLSWRQGFGEARLFPIKTIVDSLPDSTLYLFEGEMDTLLAQQHGLPAVTTTGGAGTWREGWNEYFRGRRVVVCYDNDDAGRLGAGRIAHQLRAVATEVKVVSIPLQSPPGADFTDYIVGHGHTVEEFLALVTATPVYAPTVADTTAPEPDDPVDVHFSQASEARFHNKYVTSRVIVSGKTMAPYIVPLDVECACTLPALRMCERCPVADSQSPHAGLLRHTIQFHDNEVLEFVDVNDAFVKRQIKSELSIPARCPLVDIKATVAQNIEAVQLIPEIERTTRDAPYVTRLAYYMGHGLTPNQSYVMTMLTVPHPKSQLATHIITKSVPSQSNIDAFQLTEDAVEQLKVFRPAGRGVRALWDHLDAIYTDLERVTRIYQRRDIMLAVDLVYHSPLRFMFQGQEVQRGWCEALIIGDTRTGKSTIVNRLIDHYGAGELTTGENTTLAGLIGGLHQVGETWALRWGRVPLNDRRLLAIDEASNLPPEQIARMSSMRSSGVAEVVKVHTERTNSRTRLLWISNPRSPRPLSSFSHGVLAVKELLGAPEDIARLDLVVTAASADVTLDTVNAERVEEEPQTFTGFLCHQRVMWAWSRQHQEEGYRVEWAAGAEAKVLELATVQGDVYRYATEIPLVEPNEQRIKLARLAVSAAAMFFSTDQTGRKVLVRPEHVEFVYEFLERLYASRSLSYREYATQQTRRYELHNEADVREIVTRTPDAAQQLMEQEQFTQRDLQEILSYDERDALRAAMSKLRQAGFLRRQGSSYYLKTPAAIIWLRRYLGQTDQPDF